MEQGCRGFGGSFSIELPMLPAELLERRLDHVEATVAGMLVRDSPGCVLQLRGGRDRRGGGVDVKQHRRCGGRGPEAPKADAYSGGEISLKISSAAASTSAWR
jgi:Fe-S oxidoreductase